MYIHGMGPLYKAAFNFEALFLFIAFFLLVLSEQMWKGRRQVAIFP